MPKHASRNRISGSCKKNVVRSGLGFSKFSRRYDRPGEVRQVSFFSQLLRVLDTCPSPRKSHADPHNGASNS